MYKVDVSLLKKWENNYSCVIVSLFWLHYPQWWRHSIITMICLRILVVSVPQNYVLCTSFHSVFTKTDAKLMKNFLLQTNISLSTSTIWKLLVSNLKKQKLYIVRSGKIFINSVSATCSMNPVQIRWGSVCVCVCYWDVCVHISVGGWPAGWVQATIFQNNCAI